MSPNFFGRHGEIEEGSVAYDKETNRSRGFGFVTYKTVEAAKRAIDDPQKMLGGRNITVKLADNYKGNVMQTQLPPAFVPGPVGLTSGYPPAHNVHSGSGTPVGHAYPPPLAAYPSSVYSSPPVAAGVYSAQQPQTSYMQFGHKKDSPTPPPSLGGYPYYMPKQ